MEAWRTRDRLRLARALLMVGPSGSRSSHHSKTGTLPQRQRAISGTVWIIAAFGQVESTAVLAQNKAWSHENGLQEASPRLHFVFRTKPEDSSHILAGAAGSRVGPGPRSQTSANIRYPWKKIRRLRGLRRLRRIPGTARSCKRSAIKLANLENPRVAIRSM